MRMSYLNKPNEQINKPTNEKTPKPPPKTTTISPPHPQQKPYSSDLIKQNLSTSGQLKTALERRPQTKGPHFAGASLQSVPHHI